MVATDVYYQARLAAVACAGGGQARDDRGQDGSEDAVAKDVVRLGVVDDCIHGELVVIVEFYAQQFGWEVLRIR
jgi:hypothetical protein